MWFQAAECNAVNASVLLNLINNNFLTFLTENLPILNPYLPPKSENLRPHYTHSSRENATPSSGTSPLASCKGVPPRCAMFFLSMISFNGLLLARHLEYHLSLELVSVCAYFELVLKKFILKKYVFNHKKEKHFTLKIYSQQ